MLPKVTKCIDARTTHVAFGASLVLSVVLATIIFGVGITQLPKPNESIENLYTHWYGKVNTIYHEFTRMCKLYTEVAMKEIQLLVKNHIKFTITDNGVIPEKDYSKFLNQTTRSHFELLAQEWAFRKERACLGLGFAGAIVSIFSWISIFLITFALYCKRKQRLYLAYKLFLSFVIVLSLTIFVQFGLGVAVGGCSYLVDLKEDPSDIDSSFVNCRSQFDKARLYFVQQLQIYQYNNTKNLPQNAFVDMIQFQYSCCGSENYTDWKTNQYYACSAASKVACQLPPLCCNHSSDCSKKDVLNSKTVPTGVHRQGCFRKTLTNDESAQDYILKPMLPRSLFVEGGFLIFLALLELFPLVIGLLYAASLKSLSDEIPMTPLTSDPSKNPAMVVPPAYGLNKAEPVNAVA